MRIERFLGVILLRGDGPGARGPGPQKCIGSQTCRGQTPRKRRDKAVLRKGQNAGIAYWHWGASRTCIRTSHLIDQDHILS